MINIFYLEFKRHLNFQYTNGDVRLVVNWGTAVGVNLGVIQKWNKQSCETGLVNLVRVI